MRLDQSSGGRSHDALTDVTAHQHHPRPATISILNTSQVIAAGAAFNLDIALGRSGYQAARLQIMGPKTTGFATALWREAASVHVAQATSDAIGHSTRDTGSNYKSYCVTYSKSAGTTNLTHKIFDSVTPLGARYIALQDAQIIGATLRLTFKNYDSNARTLWVKGQAEVY